MFSCSQDEAPSMCSLNPSILRLPHKGCTHKCKVFQSAHIHLTSAHTHADGNFWDSAGRYDYEEAGSQLICATINLGCSPICKYVNYQKYNYSLEGGGGGGGWGGGLVLFPHLPSLPHHAHTQNHTPLFRILPIFNRDYAPA